MSYQNIRKHIVNILAPRDHKHLEMREALLCKSCGKKMAKAQDEVNRLYQERPKEFLRQPEEEFSRETQNLGQMLEDRLKKDKLYKEHLRLLVFGNEEEKKREQRRMRTGYYRKHSNYETAKIL